MLARQQVHNAAALIVDNQTFEVLAYVGTEQFQRMAVDPIARLRGRHHPPAAQHGQHPQAAAVRRHARGRRAHAAHAAARRARRTTKASRPRTSTASIAARCAADEALAHSLNVPAVRMLKTYGVRALRRPAARRGHEHAHAPAPTTTASRSILGGAEGNLWDISAMYAEPRRHRARRRGRRRRRASANSRCCAAHPPEARGRVAIGTGAAWLTLDALLEVPRPGEEGHWQQLRLQPPHRLEDRHELGPARRLGRRQHSRSHGGRVGGQRQRRRPPRPHGLDAWPRR